MAADKGKIVDAIEAKLGPVGPGHHNSHRSEHLMQWLKKQPKGKLFTPGTRHDAKS